MAVLVFDGAEELDALGPYEVLALAARAGGSLTTTLATSEPCAQVRLQLGTVIRPHGVLPHALDWLVVPGGGWTDPGPGVRALCAGAVPALLAARHAGGTRIASVCTGAMLLAAAGLLIDRPAVTHHTALDDLAAAGARVVRRRVVDDGDVVTSGGITAGIDMALHLVRRELGATLAQRVAAELEWEGVAPAAR